MGAQVQLSDFVGDYGPYQLYITVFLFVRNVLLGLMANSGPLMTPDVVFYCKLPLDEIVAIMPNITKLTKAEQELEIREEFNRTCQLDLHLYQQAYLNSSLHMSNGHRFNSTNRIRECTEFTYDIEQGQGRTMTSEFDLVCDRDSYRFLFQSLLSAAIVLGHVFWGTFSDKYGRQRAQKLSILVSTIAGSTSFFVLDFWTFVALRALGSFGDLGLVVSLTTTMVELVGSQYRGVSVAVVNFGYALGVTALPYIVAYFEDFRKVIVFTVLCNVLTAPIILTTDESVRWLLTNRRFSYAQKELIRIVRWNRNFTRWMCIFWSQRRSKNQTDFSTMKLKKQTFHLLFNRLIDQVESLNLYDPLGSGEHIAPKSDEPPKIIDEAKIELETLPEFMYPRLDQVQISEESEKSTEYDGCKIATNFMELPDRPKSNTQLTLEDCEEILTNTNNDKTEAPQQLDEIILVRHPTQHPDCINIVTSQLSFVGRVNQLFRDKQLMLVVFTIVWTTFNSELQYTSFIIINLEVGEDVYLNYFLGGCMEALATVTASLLLSYAPRRHSLIVFWLLISLSCFGLSVAHIDSTWAVWLLALAKFSQSSLSSIASVAAYESFPTFLRQSGSGLVFTLGMLGSVFAPLIFAEFDDQVGMDRVLMTFSLSSLTAATLIFLYLRETKNCELQ